MTAAKRAFSELMRIAGRSEPGFVAVEQAAPALKTRFHAEEAAAAALAAGAAVAADLWTMRGGVEQEVRVSTRETAAGLVSFLHQKFDDASKAPPMRGQLDAARTAANGFQKTRDGRHIFLHPSFPESTRRLLRVLDCADEPDAVQAPASAIAFSRSSAS